MKDYSWQYVDVNWYEVMLYDFIPVKAQNWTD